MDCHRKLAAHVAIGCTVLVCDFPLRNSFGSLPKSADLSRAVRRALQQQPTLQLMHDQKPQRWANPLGAPRHDLIATAKPAKPTCERRLGGQP